MSASGFWRVFWKEYRTLRGFWIAMGVFGVIVQLYFVTMMAPEMYSVPTFLVGVALGVPAFYALGCTAVTFAAEREQETHDTLRAMPLRWIDLLFGKLAFAAVSAIAMILVLILIASGLSGLETNWRMPTHTENTKLAGLWLVGLVEAIAWGALFSLALASPMRAAVLGAAAAVFSAQAWASTVSTSASWLAETASYLPVVPHRLLTCAAVLVADVILARFWMGAWGDERKHVLQTVDDYRIDYRRQQATTVEPRRGRVLRLVWQDLKQNRVLFYTFAGVTVLAALLIGVSRVTPFTVVFASLLVGASAFLSDQTNASYRFFANHGISPRIVWFSRQLAMMLRAAALVAAFAIVVVIAVLLFLRPDYSRFPPLSSITSTEWFWQTVTAAILALMAPLAIGQLASLLIRSQIVAFVVTVAIGGMFALWCSTIYRLGMSLWWAGSPILAIFFMVSWLRAPDWMLDRGGWRPWAKIGAAFFTPLLALALGVMFYRVYQVPLVELGFSPAEFATEISLRNREKAELYERATHMVSTEPFPARDESEDMLKTRRAEWFQENQPALEAALSALAMPGRPYRDPLRTDTWPGWGNGYLLDSLFQQSASELEKKGDMTGALDRHFALIQFSRDMKDVFDARLSQMNGELIAYNAIVSWAAHTSLTSAEIRPVIERLKTVEGTLPPLSEDIKANYLTAQWLLKLWREQPSQFVSEIGLTRRRDVLWIIGTGLFPTEHWRAERLMNALTQSGLTFAQNIEQAASAGKPIGPRWGEYAIKTSAFPNPSSLFLAAYSSPIQLPGFYGRTRGLPLGPAPLAEVENEASRWIFLRKQNRETRLILALIAWKKDHNGELPDDLTKLEGEYIDKIPLSLHTGTPFQLRRQGPDDPNTPADESKLPDFVWDPQREFDGWHYSGGNRVP